MKVDIDLQLGVRGGLIPRVTRHRDSPAPALFGHGLRLAAEFAGLRSSAASRRPKPYRAGSYRRSRQSTGLPTKLLTPLRATPVGGGGRFVLNKAALVLAER